MESPIHCGSTGVAGIGAMAVSWASQPSMVPSTISRIGQFGISGATPAAVSRRS